VHIELTGAQACQFSPYSEIVKGDPPPSLKHTADVLLLFGSNLFLLNQEKCLYLVEFWPWNFAPPTHILSGKSMRSVGPNPPFLFITIAESHPLSSITMVLHPLQIQAGEKHAQGNNPAA